MPDDTAMRYRAFISYSHRDERFSARLHRRLESYRPPRHVLTDSRDDQHQAGRIRPVFRDQEELASSDSLTDSIQTALDASEVLIVLCSPASANSRWVNEEIRYYRKNFPDRKVYPIVIGGDPGADPRKQPETASFPLAILLADPDDPEGPYREPLAADARKEADGFSIAFLKLAAGILDVPFDRLRQRDLRRRQGRLAFALMVSAVLSVTLAVLAWRATVARDEARAARAQAEFELTSERQTRAFLLSVFKLADPGEARGEEVTVREVLDAAVARIDSTGFARPVIKSRFLATLGEAYSSLGINRRSVELLEQSLAGLPTEGDTSEDISQRIDSQVELADVLFDMGDYETAMNLLDDLSQHGYLVRASSAQLAHAANVRGDILSYEERADEAMEAYQQALRILDSSSLSPEQEASIRSRSLGGLGVHHLFAGNFSLSQQHYAEAVELLLPVFGEQHPDSIWAMVSWGGAAYSNGDEEAAREAWQKSLAAAIRVLGPNNPEVGTIKNNLGRLLLEEGDHAGAERLLRDAIAIDRAHRTEQFDELVYPLVSLAVARMAQGGLSEAEQLLQEARLIAESRNHRMRGEVWSHLADLGCRQSGDTVGMQLAEQAVTANTQAFGADDWHALRSQLILQYCRHRHGLEVDYEKIPRALDVIEKRWQRENYYVLRSREQARDIR